VIAINLTLLLSLIVITSIAKANIVQSKKKN